MPVSERGAADPRRTPRAGRRIVLATFGSFGDLNPYLGLALGLRDRGHHPILATTPYYRDAVEREGIAFHPVRPDGDPSDPALLAHVMHPRRGSEFVVRDVVMAHFRESAADLASALEGADLLVTHPLTFAGPVLAEASGLPWVSAVLAPLSLFSRHDPPVFPGLPALQTLARVPAVADALLGLARIVTRRWVRDVYRLRSERGLPRGGHPIFEGQHSPTLVLALFSRLLARPQPDWPPNLSVTGPVWYNGGGGHALDPALERFLAAGPSPVVFTLGTSAVGAAGSFYEVSAEAAMRAGLRAVMLVGRHRENRPSRALPDSIMAIDQAPHEALLPRAALVVHQGGAGTLHQSMRAGRPMIVVPHAHDQADNAWRASQLGVARVLTPRRYRAARVAGTMQALLDDAAVIRRAQDVSVDVRQEDGVATACDAIEAQLAHQ